MNEIPSGLRLGRPRRGGPPPPRPRRTQCLRHQLGLGDAHTLTRQDLLQAATRLGLKAKPTQSTVDCLSLARLSALALMREGRWVVPVQSRLRLCLESLLRFG